MDCPNCSHEIPAHYSGLFCPKCGRSLWQARHEEDTEEQQPADSQAEDSRQQPTFRPPQPQVSVPSGEGTSSQSVEETKSCPWEQRDTLGGIRGFFKTLFQCLFTPSSFYRRLPTSGGYADPLLFAILVSLLGAIVAFAWGRLTGHAVRHLLSSIDSFAPLLDLSQTDPRQKVWEIGFVIATPILTIMYLFLATLFYHVLLRLLGAGRSGFEATFRTIAYANCVSFLFVIPFLGPLAAGIAYRVLIILGFARVHKMSGGKACVVGLLPVVLVWGLIFLLALLFMLTLFIGG